VVRQIPKIVKVTVIVFVQQLKLNIQVALWVINIIMKNARIKVVLALTLAKDGDNHPLNVSKTDAQIGIKTGSGS
jgi:hypothetical protein